MTSECVSSGLRLSIHYSYSSNSTMSFLTMVSILYKLPFNTARGTRYSSGSESVITITYCRNFSLALPCHSRLAPRCRSSR